MLDPNNHLNEWFVIWHEWFGELNNNLICILEETVGKTHADIEVTVALSDYSFDL